MSSWRASFDTSRRRGTGFAETHPFFETEDLRLITGPAGTQPTLRYYDEADQRPNFYLDEPARLLGRTGRRPSRCRQDPRDHDAVTATRRRLARDTS